MRIAIFDIGGVLINFDFARLARALSAGDGGNAESLLPLFGAAVVGGVETGRIGPREFFEQTMGPRLPHLDYEGWTAAWMENYSLNEPGWQLLQEARERGLTVCLLSNLAPYNQVAIERRFPGFFAAPHHSFFSYELGLHKPSPAIFKRVCELLKAPAGDCLFLDDIEDNVVGARKAGMDAMVFSNPRVSEIRQALEQAPAS